MAQRSFGQDPLTTPLPGFTRWLTVGPCITRLLMKWDVLLVYFQDQAQSASQGSEIAENSPRGILNNLKDPCMHLWLTFLSFVLKIVEGANEILQAIDPIIDQTKDVMTNLTLKLLSFYMRPQHLQNVTDLNSVDPNNALNTLPLNHIVIGDNTSKLLNSPPEPGAPVMSVADKRDFMVG